MSLARWLKKILAFFCWVCSSMINKSLPSASFYFILHKLICWRHFEVWFDLDGLPLFASSCVVWCCFPSSFAWLSRLGLRTPSAPSLDLFVGSDNLQIRFPTYHWYIYWCTDMVHRYTLIYIYIAISVAYSLSHISSDISSAFVSLGVWGPRHLIGVLNA